VLYVEGAYLGWKAGALALKADAAAGFSFLASLIPYSLLIDLPYKLDLMRTYHARPECLDTDPL